MYDVAILVRQAVTAACCPASGVICLCSTHTYSTDVAQKYAYFLATRLLTRLSILSKYIGAALITIKLLCTLLNLVCSRSYFHC